MPRIEKILVSEKELKEKFNIRGDIIQIKEFVPSKWEMQILYGDDLKDKLEEKQNKLK